MTTIQECDIRLVLGRIRPGAEYGWRGDGDTGHTMEAVDWRDSATQKPTETEVLTEWGLYQAEEAARQVESAQEETDLDAVAQATVQAGLAQIAAAREAIVTGQAAIAADLLILGGTPTNAQVVAILRRALNRENATLNGLDGILNRQSKIIQAVARIRERVR